MKFLAFLSNTPLADYLTNEVEPYANIGIILLLITAGILGYIFYRKNRS